MKLRYSIAICLAAVLLFITVTSVTLWYRREVFHPGTSVLYSGTIAQIEVPRLLDEQEKFYLANAPLEDLAIVLRHHSELTMVNVTWFAEPPGYWVSGSAIYDRKAGTVEVHTENSWAEGTDIGNIRYEGVTDAKLYNIATVHTGALATDGALFNDSAFFDELTRVGCKFRSLASAGNKN